MIVGPDDRAAGAIAGLFIGDALAMPVHWYYDTGRLLADYGWVAGYLAPKNPHPDSILWRSRFPSPGAGFDILHEQRQYWGTPGIHYHQFLEAGENTLNLQCARLLMDVLEDNGEYRPEDYLNRYIDFMTTPGRCDEHHPKARVMPARKMLRRAAAVPVVHPRKDVACRFPRTFCG